MTTPRRRLPRCGWCGHTWLAHWHPAGCQTPIGIGELCGCNEPPHDDETLTTPTESDQDWEDAA